MPEFKHADLIPVPQPPEIQPDPAAAALVQETVDGIAQQRKEERLKNTSPMHLRQNQLSDLEQENNPKKAEVQELINSATEKKFESLPYGKANLRDHLNNLQARGLENVMDVVGSQLTDQTLINSVMIEADAATDYVLKGLGIQDSLDPKTALELNGYFRMQALIANTPLSERDEIKLVGKVFREQLKTQMEQRRAEVAQLKGQVSEGALSEVNRLESQYNDMAQWSDEEYYEAYVHSLKRMSDLSQTSLSNVREKEIVQNLEGSDLMIGARGIYTLYDAAQGLGVYAKGSIAHKFAQIEEQLGKGWQQRILIDFRNQRAEVNRNKAGIRVSAEGKPVTGQLIGERFIDMMPEETLKKVVDNVVAAKGEEGRKQWKEVWDKNLTWVQKLFGSAAAKRRFEEQYNALVEDQLAGLVQSATLKEEAIRKAEENSLLTAAGLSPVAKDKMATLDMSALWIANGLNNVFRTIRSIADISDETAAAIFPKAGQDAHYFWTGNAAVSRTTKTPLQAIVGITKGLAAVDDWDLIIDRLRMIDRKAYIATDDVLGGALSRFFGDMRRNLPNLRNVTNEELAGSLYSYYKGANDTRLHELSVRENLAGEAIREPFKEYYDREHQRQTRMRQYIQDPTKADFWQWTKDSASSFLFGIMSGAVEVSAALVDDPAEGLSYMVGGALLYKGGKFSRHVRRIASDRVLHLHGLAQKATRLAYHDPKALIPLRDKIQSVIASHADNPGATQRLEMIEALIDDLNDAYENGLPRRKDALKLGRLMKEAWGDLTPHLDQGELSLAARSALETGLGNLFERLDQQVFGRMRKPGKWFDFFNAPRLFTKAEHAVDKMIRVSKNEADDTAFQKEVLDFQAKEGRWPSDKEMLHMLPESERSLPHLLHALDMVPSEHPFWQKIAAIWKFETPSSLWGARGAGVLQKVRASADQILNQLFSTMVGKFEARMRWGPIQTRYKRILDLQERVLQNRANRLATQQAILKTMAKNTPDDPHRGDWLANASEIDGELQANLTQRNRIQRFQERLLGHDPNKPFAAAEELLGTMDPDDVAAILETHPELFEGLTVETVFDQRRKPPQGYASELKTAAGVLENLRHRAQKLNDALDAAEPNTPEWARLYTLKERVRDAWRATQSRVRTILTPSLGRVFNRDGVKRFLRQFNHSGMDKVFQEPTAKSASLFDILQASGEVLQLKGNPFAMAAFPFLKKASVLANTGATTRAFLQSKLIQVSDMSQIVQKMSRNERLIYARAKRQGISPAALAKKYPALIKKGTDIERLEELFWRETELFDEAHELLRKAGIVDDKMAAELKNLGYTPPVYGLHALTELAQSADVSAFKRALKQRTGGKNIQAVAQLTNLSELQLRRDLRKWRVRIEEPNRIINESFDSLDDAKAYLHDNYSPSLFGKLKEKDAIFRGNNEFGDLVQIVKPIGKKGLKALLYQGQELTPIARLRRLETMFRDAYMNSYVKALNLYGGLVLDQAQLGELRKQHGVKIAGQFIPVPKNVRHFGDLAGKNVHKRIFAEMGNMARTQETVRSFMRGVQEAFEQAGAPITEALLGKAQGVMGAAFTGMDNLVRFSQILAAPSVWVTNAMFNVLLDTMGGFGAYDLGNLKNLVWSIKQTLPIRRGMVRDPIYNLALEKGVLSGSFFDQSNIHIRQAWSKMLGLERKNLKKLKQIKTEREKFLRQTERTVGGEMTEETVNQHLHLAALESHIDELSAGFMKRVGRFFAGFAYDRKNPFGVPDNQLVSTLRLFYNQIDEHFKLAAFKNLLERGMDVDQAVWRVKTFAQDYSQVPRALSHGGRRDSLLSLITSFPSEMVRLSKNYMYHYPARVLGLMAALPAMNLSSMALSGVNWDRMQSIIGHRGAKSDADVVKYFMTHLIALNSNGDVVTDVDVGNWFIPFAEITTARGTVGVGLDSIYPPEDRSLVGSMAVGAIGFANQFFLNNPRINSIAYLMGRDPITGELLVDRDAPLSVKIGQTLKAWSQMVIPSWFPHIPGTPIVGRGFEKTETAWKAPLGTTGKPFQAPAGVFSSILRTFTGLDVRGVPALLVDKGLGKLKDEQKLAVVDSWDIATHITKTVQRRMQGVEAADLEDALYSPYIDLRRQYYKIIQEADTPEEKKAALEDFRKTLMDQGKRKIGPLEVPQGMTEREAETFMQRLESYDPVNTFERMPVDQQATVLAWLDKALVVGDKWQKGDPVMIDFVSRFLMTNDVKLKERPDPGKLQTAVQILRERIAEGTHNPRLDTALDLLEQAVLPQSETAWTIERTLAPIKKEINDRKVDIRDKVTEMITRPQ